MSDDDPKHTVIDAAIDEGADRFSRVERAKVRAMLAAYERAEDNGDLKRLDKILKSDQRSEWLRGKFVSWTKATFACAAAAVAIKALFGDFFLSFIKALQQVMANKP